MASLLPAMRRVVRTALIYAVPAVVLAVMLPATAIAASGSDADSSTGYHAASSRIEQVGRRHGGKGYGGGYGRRSGYGNMNYGRNSYGNNGYSRSGYGNGSGAYCNTYGKSNYGSYGNSGYSNSSYGNSDYDSSGYGESGYGSAYTSSGNYATGTYQVEYPAQQVAQPGAVTLQMGSSDSLGAFLVGPNGMTLYTLDHDTPNQSVCTGDCAQAWPLMTVTAGTAPVAAEGATGALGVITRADGTWQVTYNQRPLYYFAQDQRVGDTKGNGIENVWWVAAP